MSRSLIVFILLLIGAERLVPYRRAPLLRAGFFSDLIWYMLVQSSLVSFLQWEALPTGGPLWGRSFAVQLGGAFLVSELMRYTYHRLLHAYRMPWTVHEVHHSSRVVDWLAGARVHALELAVGSVLLAAAFYALGVGADVVAVLGAASAFYGLFEHSNVRLKTGPLQYVLISPEMHRIHHLQASRFQNANYGNILSVWDWLFGTAVYPVETEYGSQPFGVKGGYPQNFWEHYPVWIGRVRKSLDGRARRAPQPDAG